MTARAKTVADEAARPRLAKGACGTCGRGAHPAKTCDAAALDRDAVAGVIELEARLARAPTVLVVSRRPLDLGDDRPRRVEVLECGHEITVFATDHRDPTRRCERCVPNDDPTTKET